MNNITIKYHLLPSSLSSSPSSPPPSLISFPSGNIETYHLIVIFKNINI